MRCRYWCVILFVVAASCTRTHSSLSEIKTVNADLIQKRTDTTITPIELREDSVYRN